MIYFINYSNFGLNIGISLQNHFVYGLDPVNIFSLDDKIEKLKNILAKDKLFFNGLINKYFISNTHKVFKKYWQNLNLYKIYLKQSFYYIKQI